MASVTFPALRSPIGRAPRRENLDLSSIAKRSRQTVSPSTAFMPPKQISLGCHPSFRMNNKYSSMMWLGTPGLPGALNRQCSRHRMTKSAPEPVPPRRALELAVVHPIVLAQTGQSLFVQPCMTNRRDPLRSYTSEKHRV